MREIAYFAIRDMLSCSPHRYDREIINDANSTAQKNKLANRDFDKSLESWILDKA